MGINTSDVAPDAHSVAKGAGAWPDRMPDVADSGSSLDISYTMSMGSLAGYCASDEIDGMKPSDEFNRVDYSGDKNTTRMQTMEVNASGPTTK